MLSVFGQFATLATDNPETTIVTPNIDIASPWEPVATAGLFLTLVAFSWWVARKLASRSSGLFDSLIGGIFGALASILALSQSFDYWADFVQRSGNNPTANTPHVSVGIAALPSSNPLVGLATVAIGLFLLIIIVYTILRAAKAAH
jgi:hypothetical protein